ncbi:hypothetical protein DFH07DRAFT_726623, partial [Mycena maculata]
IVDFHDEIGRHDDDISRFRAQLRSMESDREALQTHYDAYHSLISPLRRVPTEILVAIFVL